MKELLLKPASAKELIALVASPSPAAARGEQTNDLVEQFVGAFAHLLDSLGGVGFCAGRELGTASACLTVNRALS